MNKRYCNGMVHVIKQGETLYQLSRRYRVPLALILRANPYVDVYNLQVGQEICIPMTRPFNGMVCMPVQGMGRGNGRMQNNMQGQMSGDMQNQMTEESGEDRREQRMESSSRNMQEESQMGMQAGMVEMESEPSCEESVAERDAGCRVCESEGIEKNDTGDRNDRDDVEIYITMGDRSLGDILNEYGVKWEDFIKKNDLTQILLGEDVVLYLPKKTVR